MKKIVFGITSLTLGGAERVLVDMVNQLSDTFDITIFTIYGKGELEKSLNDKIKVKRIFDKPYKEFSKFEKINIPLKILCFQKQYYNARQWLHQIPIFPMPARPGRYMRQNPCHAGQKFPVPADDSNEIHHC